MNVSNPFSGNGDTNGRGAKVIGALMAMLVLVSMVSMPVAAFSAVDSVSDVDADGTQTIAIAPDSGGSPAAGDTVRITTTGASPDLDYSNATISHDGAGSVTNNSSTALDLTYTLDSTDVTEGTPITFTVEGVESTASTQDTVEVDYLDNGTITDSSTFSAVDTTAPTQYEVSGVVEDEAGNAVSDGGVAIIDSDGTEVASTALNSDGTYSVQVADGDYEVSHTADGYESGNYSITVNGAAETQDIVVSQLVDYDVDVVDDGTSVDEFTYTLNESDGTEFGSIDKTNGELVTVTQLTVGDEYTAQVTVQEEDADGNMVDVTYEKTFTAEAPADGSSAVSQTLDINTMNEVSDDDGTTIIDSGGETASTLFEQLVQGVEDTLSVSADLALVIGGFAIIVIGGVVVVFFRGIRSSF